MKSSIWQRARRKLLLKIFNNSVSNRLFIMLGNEEWIQRLAINWTQASYDPSKSPGQNVGFSDIPEIQASREKMHSLLHQLTKSYLKQDDRILEIGCGTGLFLKPLQDEYSVTGVDLSDSFLAKAHELVPKATLIHGNYLTVKFPDRFRLIFLESSLQYFVPGKLNTLFNKFHEDLLSGGLLLIHYSHALSRRDVRYGDLSYVRYSPRVIETEVRKHFTILEHHHYTDDRVVDVYDKHRHYFPGQSKKRTDTNLNTYLLIAQRD